jgi:hypothetical protein
MLRMTPSFRSVSQPIHPFSTPGTRAYGSVSQTRSAGIHTSMPPCDRPGRPACGEVAGNQCHHGIASRSAAKSDGIRRLNALQRARNSTRQTECADQSDREAHQSQSHSFVSLTKMNYNNAFGTDNEPITIRFARKVGEILSYVPEGQPIQPSYQFYM